MVLSGKPSSSINVEIRYAANELDVNTVFNPNLDISALDEI